jgi:SPP1 gp7 family putative phage head morphogenesis protein
LALNDDILDAQVSHMIGHQRLTNSEVRQMLKLLSKMDAKISERLLAGGSALSRARQAKLLATIKEIVSTAHTDAAGALSINLDALAVYEGAFQADLFKRIIPVQLETVLPSPYQLKAAVNSRPFQGKLLKDWFTDLEASSFARVRETISMGFTEGRTTAQMVRDLRGTRAGGYKDGILAINRRAAEATVRTAVAHTANAAKSAMFEANADLIKGVQWISTLDGRTSAVCRARDGQVYEPNKGPRPPAHINCRSSTTPILKSWQELGLDLKDAPVSTRSSMDGQVAADLNYNGWLKNKSAAFQDDVLGNTKGKLFRKGGLSMDRFVNRAGREYTLDELKTRESAAWTAAGL